jgi:hypothetical protein
MVGWAFLKSVPCAGSVVYIGSENKCKWVEKKVRFLLVVCNCSCNEEKKKL